MKHPFKPGILPYFTLGAGLVGLGLRIWLYTGGVDEKNLFITGHPANTLLLILTAVTLLCLVLCVLPLTGSPAYSKLFPPSIWSFVGCGVGCAGILATDLYELLQRTDAITLLSLVLGLAAGASLLYVGYCRYRDLRPGFLFRAVVTVYFMLHLVSQYRLWSAEPQLQNYFFALLASVFLMLSAYQRTTLDAGQKVRRWYVFCNQAALFCSLVAAVGNSGIFYLTMGFWTLTELCSLKRVRRSRAKADFSLPRQVRVCIATLEDAGYQAYAVGGCVRDTLLGLTPQDYDLCTDATPDVIAKLFAQYRLVRSGEKHGTIGVVMDGAVYEITTFRVEGGYADSRHPDWVKFVTTVEEDLARRDFTVNAMAYAPRTGLIDPWGGQQDLQDMRLRAVGDPATRFAEDPLRILRGVRFAVRFRMTVEPQTQQAMENLCVLMDTLARERVFDELCKLLPQVTAQDLIRFAPILTQAIPELAPCVGFDQHSPYHAFDVYTHIAHVTEAVEPELALRWAALLHDIAKPQAFTTDELGQGHFPDHAPQSADTAETILTRLKAPTALRETVVFLIRHHMVPFQQDKKLLRRAMGRYGPENCRLLLALQRADFCSKGTQSDPAYYDAIDDLFAQLRQEAACLTTRDLAINGHDLLALGFAPGPRIGTVMKSLLEQVQDERLPNARQALLDAAQAYKECP